MFNKLCLCIITLLISSIVLCAFGCRSHASYREGISAQLPLPSPEPKKSSEKLTYKHFVIKPAEPPPPGSQGTLVDEQNAWVGLVRTIDRGRTWQQLRPSVETESFLDGSSAMYVSTYFITPTSGWLLLSSGVWQTDNGGITWRRIFADQADPPHFSDGQHGWMNVVSKSYEQSYITEDSGRTWQPCGPKRYFKDQTPNGRAYFLSPQLGWAVTDHSANRQTINGVARSIDGGCHWQQLWISNQNPDETFGDIYFLNEYQGWLAGSYLGTLYHTNDGGKTWDKLPVPVKGVGVLNVYFANSSDGWIITALRSAHDTGMYRTANGGQTWQQLSEAQIVSGADGNGGTNDIPVKWKAGKLFQMLYASKASNHPN